MKRETGARPASADRNACTAPATVSKCGRPSVPLRESFRAGRRGAKTCESGDRPWKRFATGFSASGSTPGRGSMRLSAVGLFTALALLAVPVQAQQDEDAVVVTATRFPERRLDA